MKFLGTIKEAKIRQWYWYFQAGKPVKKGNIMTLINKDFSNIKSPVFFLSTGRTGTAWFADLFKNSKEAMVFHAAEPNLSIQNKYFYNLLNNSSLDQKTKTDIGKEIFLAGREEYLVYSYKTNKIFLETNNQFVFFAKSIAELLPNAKFVHLYRHPGEFVRSGLSRNWYGEGELSKIKLIEPNNNPNWYKYNQIQKISWLWTEINSYIIDFLNTLNPNRVFSFNFNNKSFDNIKKLSEFCGIFINEKTVMKKLNIKINVQKFENIDIYENWETDKKIQLKNICNPLAEKLGYNL